MSDDDGSQGYTDDAEMWSPGQSLDATLTDSFVLPSGAAVAQPPPPLLVRQHSRAHLVENAAGVSDVFCGSLSGSTAAPHGLTRQTSAPSLGPGAGIDEEEGEHTYDDFGGEDDRPWTSSIAADEEDEAAARALEWDEEGARGGGGAGGDAGALAAGREVSQMDSLATYSTGWGSSAEFGDGCPEDKESGGSHAQGLGDRATPPSQEALAAARAHLAAVAEELASIQEAFVDGSASERGGSEVANQFRSLKQNAKHLEVDRDRAVAKAKRLEDEREELLAALARLEAELRSARKEVEDVKRRLRHREMDLQQATGRVVEEAGPLEGTCQAPPPGLASPTLQREASEAQQVVATNRRQPVGPPTKAQALTALRECQAELQHERKSRDRTERRSRKDRERLERVLAVAERQRREIDALREVATTAPAADPGAALPPPPFGGGGGGGGRRALGGGGGGCGDSSPAGSSRGSISRQQSAPTRLPSVVASPAGGPRYG